MYLSYKKQMKKAKKYIRGKDDFGHNISLNFD